MTAQELIAALSARYLDTKQMLPDELAHESAAMLRQQAEQIEALTKMLVISDDTHQAWMKANAPSGWIDDLRIERDALIALSEQLTRERDALKADAERYKWLKANCALGIKQNGNGWSLNTRQCVAPDCMKDVDAIIDAAIDAMKGKS